MPEIKGRKWQLTINNPIEKNYNHETLKTLMASLRSLVYYCMADECGETFHTHIFLISSSPIRFNTLKKLIPESHIERVRGTNEQNRNYILKADEWAEDEKSKTSIEGSFEEWGELPPDKSGSRSDLAVLYEMIKDGMSNAEIMETTPAYMFRNHDIDYAREIIRAEQYQEVFRQLEVTYIWGKTGVGKTRFVMDTFGYKNVYKVSDYTHPFDMYGGEPVLLLDEFRGELKITEMLQLLDGYPLQLRARYNNKIACYDKVFIVSNDDLIKQYPNIQTEKKETWRAFLRRIHWVFHFLGNGKEKKLSIEEYIKENTPAPPDLDELKKKKQPEAIPLEKTSGAPVDMKSVLLDAKIAF